MNSVQFLGTVCLPSLGSVLLFISWQKYVNFWHDSLQQKWIVLGCSRLYSEMDTKEGSVFFKVLRRCQRQISDESVCDLEWSGEDKEEVYEWSRTVSCTLGRCFITWAITEYSSVVYGTVWKLELYLTITAVWVGQEQLATKSKYGHCYRNHVGQNFKYLMLWKGVG